MAERDGLRRGGELRGGGARTMCPDKRKKEITSLLLRVHLSRERARELAALCWDILDSANIELTPQDLKLSDFDDGSSGFSVALSDLIRHDLTYHENATWLLATLERPIVGIATMEDCRKITLSALVSVDEDLAAFEIRCPRMPPALNALQSFEFEYFVWHMCARAEDPQSGK